MSINQIKYLSFIPILCFGIYLFFTQNFDEIIKQIICMSITIMIIIIFVIYDVIYYKHKTIYIIDSNGIIQEIKNIQT